MHAVGPSAVPRRPNRAQALPQHRAVALESSAESDLPRPITLLHPPFRFDVAQLVPYRTARSVAEPMQRHL